MAEATNLYKYPSSETQASTMSSPPLLMSMSIDQSYGSVSDHGASLGHHTDYHDIHFADFHNMEAEGSSSPSTFNQWNPPSSMLSPPPAYQFPSFLAEDLVSWPDPQLFPPEVQFNEPVNGFHPTSYSDGYPQDPMISPDVQLSDVTYFDNLPSTSSGMPNFSGINIDEGSSSNTEHNRLVGNPTEFPSLSSPFSHDAAHFSRNLPAGAVPGSLAEHEPPQEQLPPAGPYPTIQTRGYPRHSYESQSNIEDSDYKKNPEAMRNSWMANYSQFVDGNKVFKIFSKHAKEKVATINTIKASVARRRNPAKFKCSIQGCGADFTRKHNLENHLKSHCGVTDRICGLCGKGFTTIPVWKRHQKSCEKAASSSKTATPKGFLDAVTSQRPA